MQYNCLIVDDEPPAIKILESYVESVPQLNVVKTCHNAFEALNVLNQEKIDLMFLDIHMPKLIGTDLLKTLPFPPKVIFTTAHKDFALEAFDLDAIDYLLKPVSFERFLKAVNKFTSLTHIEIDSIVQAPGFVYFRADRKMIKVFLDDILYIESLKDYIVVHRKNNPDLKIKQTLTSVENMLPHNLFLRIHRSFIVSSNKVTAYTKNDVEIGKIELPIGRNHQEVFKKLAPSQSSFPDDVE
ncbi:two component transcriptional regulator, LytTR family [Flavobacteriaceae bacterium MAR_2010_188]|nr:two component transcriptional regulator, LytTR family [Flavobacteriaceae bacterium MAR_2010_188]